MSTLIQKATNWGKSTLLGLPFDKAGVLPESGVRAIHFICHDDGTAIDTHTGLTWMRCAFGKTWDGKSCTGVAKPLTWDQAMALNYDFAGHNDWRVPNIDELQSLITTARSYRNTYNSIFPNAPNAAHWSSSPSTKDLSLIQFVQLPSGSIETCAKDYGFGKRVRLVRGGKSLTSSTSPMGADGMPLSSETPAYAIAATINSNSTVSHLEVPTQQPRAISNAAEIDQSPSVAGIMERIAVLENRLDTAINRIEGALAPISANQSKTLDVINQLHLRPSVSTEKPSDELLQLRQSIDRMESRFEAFGERLEMAIKPSDPIKQDHLQPSVLSNERFEQAIKSLFSGQLASMQHIAKKVDLRSDETVSLINTLLVELQRLSAYGVLSLYAKDESVNGTVPNATTAGMDSATALLAQLVELKTISLTELRALLLPLDLLPGAVINDINERALDLIGELALIEEGDTVIVQREVLLQVITDRP